MSLDRNLAFWTTELDLGPELQAAGLLLDPERLWAGSNAETLASRLSEHLQDKKLDKGTVIEALLQAPELRGVVVEPVQVTLPGQRGRGPSLELRYEAAFAETSTGACFGVVPALGWTAVGPHREACRTALIARISAGLSFEGRVEDPASLLASLGATGLRVVRSELPAYFRTAAEVRALSEKKVPRLPTVARLRIPARPASFGAEAELSSLRRAARGRTIRGVLLIGPHGVGKSALLDELVRQDQGRVEGREVWEVAPGQLLLDLMAAGEGWQQPLSEALAELRASGAWLRVTRLAELFEVGRYEGNATSIAEYLRTPLQRGELRLLTEATAEEVARIEARYPGWLDGFGRVVLPVPTTRLPSIVRDWLRVYGHGVTVTDEAVDELLRLQRRFTPHAGFPGRTLRFLDALIQSAREEAAAPVVDRDRVVARFCEETGLLRALIDPRTPLSMEEIRRFFAERVYGQPAALDAVVQGIAAMKADVARYGKPLASYLLVGPTGVGKTETAKALSELLFGGRERMVRFDMSEYASPQAVTRLVGGPEGGEGALTGAIRREPFSVLLFDEVEKAHPAFLDLLLQVLGEGRLTDDAGRIADFNAAVVLLTSNVGGAEARRAPSGFVSEDVAARMASHFERAVSSWLRPELKNRLDRVLAYAPLQRPEVLRVFDREIEALHRRPGLDGVRVLLDAGAREAIAAAGYDPAWGGRQMIRAVEERLVYPVAAELARSAPARADIAVGQGRSGLVVSAISGLRRPPEPDDAGFEAAMALHRRVRVALETRAFATLDGLALHGRKRRKKGQDVEEPNPDRVLVDRLRALEPEARAVLVDAGAAALLGKATEPAGARRTLMEARLLDALRSLHDRLVPSDSFCILGVYGRDLGLVTAFCDLELALCARLGLQVVRGVLYQHGEGVHLVEPRDREVPDDLGDIVGYELYVQGRAAAVALAPEARLVEVQGRGGTRPLRLRMAVCQLPIQEGLSPSAELALDRRIWKDLRPPDLQRRGWYEGRATRIVADGGLTDLDADGRKELTLPERWEQALVEHRATTLVDALLRRMDA